MERSSSQLLFTELELGRPASSSSPSGRPASSPPQVWAAVSWLSGIGARRLGASASLMRPKVASPAKRPFPWWPWIWCSSAEEDILLLGSAGPLASGEERRLGPDRGEQVHSDPVERPEARVRTPLPVLPPGSWISAGFLPWPAG